MIYHLVGHTASPHHLQHLAVRITEEEYASVKEAMASMLRITAIESKYDMLMQNYDELEAEMTSMARHMALFGNRRAGWASDARAIYQVNRRLVNFMTTVRMYLEHCDRDLIAIYRAGANEVARYREARSAEYDAPSIAYRAMEALRNFGQHRDIPIHRLSYAGRRSGDGDAWANMHAVRPSLDLKRIAEEGGFKAGVLSELRQSGERAELKPLLRGYMTGLRRVQNTVRALTLADEERWLAVVFGAHHRFVAGTDSPDARLRSAVVISDEDGAPCETTAVFDKFVERIRELRERNGLAVDFTRQLHSNA